MLDLRIELIEQIDLSSKPVSGTTINCGEFFSPVGQEHYKLLAYLSTLFNNADIIDICTQRGSNAMALSHNPTNRIHSFGTEHNCPLAKIPNVTYYKENLLEHNTKAKWRAQLLGSAMIFLDIEPHNGLLEYEFFEWLQENQYEGLIVCDDIWYFKGMRDNFWYKIPTHYKKDITEVGHWSGTGLIQFYPKYFEPVKNETQYTLVTAYFDLTKTPDSSQAIRDRPKEHYFPNAKATLSLDHNLVVFCEPENLAELKRLRPSYLAHKTHYITMSFEDFPLTKYRGKILENRKIKVCHDERNTASYYLLCMARYDMLKRVMKKNPFQSTHFAWVNFCMERMGFKNLIEMDAVFNLLRDKVSTCYIDYYSLSLAKNPVEYFSCGGPTTLCSGFFTGKKDYLYDFCMKVEAQFLEYLNQGYGHADEQLFCSVYLENPDMFEVYYGDYNQMVTNYIWTKDDPSFVLNHLLINSFERENYDVCLNACKMLWKSYKHGHAKLRGIEIEFLVNIYRLCLVKKGLPIILE